MLWKTIKSSTHTLDQILYLIFLPKITEFGTTYHYYFFIFFAVREGHDGLAYNTYGEFSMSYMGKNNPEN